MCVPAVMAGGGGEIDWHLAREFEDGGKLRTDYRPGFVSNSAPEQHKLLKEDYGIRKKTTMGSDL